MPVKFYLSPQANKAGEFPIRVSISVNGIRYLTTVEYSVAKDAWVANLSDDDKRKDKEKSEVVAKYVNSKGISGKVINNRIAQIKAHFSNYELQKKGKPTAAELKHQYILAIGKKQEQEEQATKSKQPSFFDYLEEFKQEQSIANQWAYGTLQCWKTFKNHMEQYDINVRFEDFDEAGITKYIVFLRSTLNMEEKTAQKQFSSLKWFLNWAIRKGYTSQDYINRYKAKFKILDKPVIFLTKEELLKLFHYEIPANGTTVKLTDNDGNEYDKEVHDAGGLAKTRDLFCFCAFTSLRYSDMANLRRNDIKNGILYVTTQKTNDSIPIDLNAFAKEILDKYAKDHFPDNRALPVISNQKMNKYLKDLGELCGFKETIKRVCFRGGKRVEETYPKYAMLGTHAGRRTFICFALSSGIPPQVVMKWTGHSDYSAMKPYIDIAEKTKANAMNLFEMELKK